MLPMAFLYSSWAMGAEFTMALLFGGAWEMVIVMKKNASESQVDHVIKWVESVGYRAHPSRGVERVIIGVVSGKDRAYPEAL
jgi:hypothetical protein